MEQHEEITIAEYQLTAESFRVGTWEHDVSQNRNALTSAMPRVPGRILDLAFQALGHEVVGLDGTPAFVTMAQAAANCPVWEQNFLNLDLPANYFDGIFANASLIHVPTVKMFGVLENLHGALTDRGALVMSMMRGDFEGLSERPDGARYVAGWEYETLAPQVEAAGFEIVDRYYRPPGLPIEQQSWLVIVAQKMMEK
jgi:Methyltransferase domain